MLSIYNAPVSKLTAYENTKLFDNVPLSFDPAENTGFVLPVCIEAVAQCETNIIFLVKRNDEGEHIFAPRKRDAITFDKVEHANEYINNTLKPKYGEKWTFKIWSLSALVK